MRWLYDVPAHALGTFAKMRTIDLYGVYLLRRLGWRGASSAAERHWVN